MILIDPRAGLLDGLAPFYYFRRDERTEFLGRARHGIRAETPDALRHFRQPDDRDNRRIKLAYDGLPALMCGSTEVMLGYITCTCPLVRSAIY